MEIYTYGDMEADTVLLQMTDDHDQSLMEQEIVYIGKLSGWNASETDCTQAEKRDCLYSRERNEYGLEMDEKDIASGNQTGSGTERPLLQETFAMITCKVDSWNKDISPWEAPPVFGNEGFGSGAADTLSFLTDEVLPGYFENSLQDKRIILGGYSLAGLFALWSAYQTDLFSGIAAASPSVWFPGFTDYARKHVIRTKAIYLSLGDREEKTRSAMSTVGDAIRFLSAHYAENGNLKSTLEWNKGNHFKEPELRTAKAFAWVIKALAGSG